VPAPYVIVGTADALLATTGFDLVVPLVPGGTGDFSAAAERLRHKGATLYGAVSKAARLRVLWDPCCIVFGGRAPLRRSLELVRRTASFGAWHNRNGEEGLARTASLSMATAEAVTGVAGGDLDVALETVTGLRKAARGDLHLAAVR